MKKFYIIFSIICISIGAKAQFSCDMVLPDSISYTQLKSLSGTCDNLSNYTLNPNPEHTPIKTIRISIDIIQRNDGSGNFNGGSSHVVSEFERLFDSANYRLEHISVHSPTLASPHIPDSKIQFQLNEVYFIKDNNLYSYASQTGRDRAVADSIYHVVLQNRSDLSTIDKEHTLHVIMLPGGTSCCGGQASGFGNKEWIVMRGYDYAFNWGSAPVNEVVGHFIHEVGHSLGLLHTFDTWYCDRFTINTTNNYMDYTSPSSGRVSLSDCQISKMHYMLMDGTTYQYCAKSYYVNGTEQNKCWPSNIIEDYVQDYCNFDYQQPISITSGQNITWNSSKNLRGNLVIGNNAMLTINCDISLPAEGKVIVNSGGRLILNEGNFKNACDDNWNGIEVKGGGYLEIDNTLVNDYCIIVKSGGTIRIVDDLNIQGNNQIEVENGGFICIDNTAAVDLQDYYSVINLHSGYNSGVNTSFVVNPGTCFSSPENFTVSGNGTINTFSQDIYIENETFSSNRYISGKNIYIVDNVKIETGANVIFNAEQDFNMIKNFECELGGTFEVK